MRPAFSSARQAAAFGLLILVFLTAPWLAGKRLIPPREQAYAAQGWKWGPIPWDEKQIFEETNDIDIAFMGSSRIDFAVDTPYVQKSMDERLGRKSVVVSICWAGFGFDSLYVTAKDLLAHRKVKMLVFYDESPQVDPAGTAKHWFHPGEDKSLTAGLEFKYQAFYYFAAMVGMPGTLLELLTPALREETNNPVPNYYEAEVGAPNPEKRLGAVIAAVGYRDLDKRNAFIPYKPQNDVTPADAFIYSPLTRARFAFARQPLLSWQYHFLDLLAHLAADYHCKLVVLHIPVFPERNDPVMTEGACWPDLMQTDVSLVGIPSRRLFTGLSEQEIKRLFYDSHHMNQNGMEYFTPLITPSLFELYERQFHN